MDGRIHQNRSASFESILGSTRPCSPERAVTSVHLAAMDQTQTHLACSQKKEGHPEARRCRRSWHQSSRAQSRSKSSRLPSRATCSTTLPFVSQRPSRTCECIFCRASWCPRNHGTVFWRRRGDWLGWPIPTRCCGMSCFRFARRLALAGQNVLNGAMKEGFCLGGFEMCRDAQRCERY